MKRLTLFIAALITLLMLAGFLGWFAREKHRQLQAAEAELTNKTEENAKAAKQLVLVTEQLNEAQDLVDLVLTESEEAADSLKSLEDQMRAALQSKDVTISELKGKLTVNILDRILFDSGEAVLKPEGEKLLLQIAGVLAEHTNRQIHVIGHTDNVPIRASARHRFPSNWELSTARATAAVRFLEERAGVDPRRLGVIGYGEFQPVASNVTSEGRAKNRRIAVVVFPEQFPGPETIDKLATKPSQDNTNSPPATPDNN